MIRAVRGSVGFVGVPHGVQLDGFELFFSHVRLHGGPAPVRRFLPELIDLVLQGRMEPGRVSYRFGPFALDAASYPLTRD